MFLEAFTAAKDPAFEERNEDRFGLRSGSWYAVIDGVTDKSGMLLPNGSSRGQEAGRLILCTLSNLADERSLFSVSAPTLLARLADAFQDRYRELGELATAREDANTRFGAQLALAVPNPAPGNPDWRLLIVGDCAIRVDGVRVLGHTQMAERLLAGWRAMVVKRVLGTADESGDPTDPTLTAEEVAQALSCGRHYCLSGTSDFAPQWAALLPHQEFERLRTQAHERLIALTPELPATVAHEVLNGGVLGAASYRNISGPLGQACIDGFEVPAELVVDEIVEAAPGTDWSFELYSDGYFGTPPDRATRVHDWEQHIAAVERDDPYKIGAHAGTKGSNPGGFSDDRTVLKIGPRPGSERPGYTPEANTTPRGGNDLAE